MGKYIDLTDMVFSRLKVISRNATKNGKIHWHCVCECGNASVVSGDMLRSGRTRSCGCLQIEVLPNRRTHGKSNTPEYAIWCEIIRRCTNKKAKSYRYYGGRGITMCDRWKQFENFLDDMGKRPSETHSIDRIDVNGNYDPSNCSWSTKSEQARNTRTPCNNTSGQKGVSWNKVHKRWFSYITVNNKRKQIGTYKSKEEAIRSRVEAEKIYWGKSS